MSYKNTGPVDCNVEVDTSNIKGKTAIITGGANGIGEAYVCALAKAGAFVVIGDVDEAGGAQLVKEFSGSVEFVKCDVTQWKDQLALFKKAAASSSTHRVDIVVANAGISGSDSIFFNDVEKEEPEEPNLKIFNVNAVGALYTVKLALHYFRRQAAQSKDSANDTSLVLQGSLAGYLDLPGALQYGFSKYGLRGLMKNLRQTEAEHGTRVNYIGPWFIKTKILSDAAVQRLEAEDIEFATVEDAGEALVKLASDTKIAGRAFAIVPRQYAPRGYMDIDYDDYTDGGFLHTVQSIATKANHRTKIAPTRT